MAASFFHGSCRRRLAFKCQNGPASGRHCRCRHVGSTAGTTAVTTTRCDVRLSLNASMRSLARRLFVIFFFALSRLPSTSLSALPSEAECRCISRPPGVVAPLALENLLLLPLTHSGGGFHPTGYLKTLHHCSSANDGSSERNLTGKTKSVQRNVLFPLGISGDVLSRCLLTPLSPSTIFFFFFTPPPLTHPSLFAPHNPHISPFVSPQIVSVPLPASCLPNP